MSTRKAGWLLVGLLCLVLWPGKSHGQSSELLDAFNRYSELDEQGRYQEALPFAEKALRLGKAEFGLDHPYTASSLNILAMLYDDQVKHAEAEPLYHRALEIGEATLGPDHPDVATSLNNLAGLYDAQGKYAKAEPLYQRSMAIWEKALGPDHPTVAQALENYAALLRETGHPRDAAIMAARAKVIRAKHAHANPVN